MAKIAILGLSITSSWGNGHATTYRALAKALALRGHTITFLERDTPWYRAHRDFSHSAFVGIKLYYSLADLKRRFGSMIAEADAVLVGSFVPEGIAVGEWAILTASGPVAFYDIDTPVTLAALQNRECTYLSEDLIAAYDLYLSFTGGPTLARLEAMGSPRAAALYCSADPGVHGPVRVQHKWELGYLGTYSSDRQDALECTLFAVARAQAPKTFAVAGAQYPASVVWPDNVQHIPHLAPSEHPSFYSAQRFTLNLTRADMKALGFSPSVRLFEAAACGVPIISDSWPGLATIFEPGKEVLIAETAGEIIRILREISTSRRKAIAMSARRRVLKEHTAVHRARLLEGLLDLAARKSVSNRLHRRALAN